MAISYRYHVGSLLAVFLALLLGILVGIGLTSRPEEFEQRLADLRSELNDETENHRKDMAQKEQQLREEQVLSKEAVATVVDGRLAGKRVAIVLDHDFGRDRFPDGLRALMAQAGATLTSTTTITQDFVTLPVAVKDKVAKELLLYPPPGVHFRSAIAEAFARDLARGRPGIIAELRDAGLLRSAADSDYSTPVDAVVVVGGLRNTADAAVERIDLPLIDTLVQERVRVVGCESATAQISCIAAYEPKGIPTVDNADTLAGHMALVLALAGADGNFGVKETASRLLPQAPPSAR